VLETDLEPSAGGSGSPRRRGYALAWIATLVAFLVTAALVGLALRREPTPPPSSAPAPQATMTLPGEISAKPAVPERGAYFGIFAHPRGVDRRQRLPEIESQLGRRFDIDHAYHAWDADFPSADDRWSAAGGRMLLLNWSSQRMDGRQVPWSDIAAGREDEVIARRAEAIKQFGRPIFLSFQHEPGNEVGLAGTTEDYTAAWRHIVEQFRTRGANNVSFVWIVTSYLFTDRARLTPEQLYPGDDVIDWIGIDGYNFYGCGRGPWRSFRDIFLPGYEWARERGKPVMVAEWGVQEDPDRPGRKAAWFREAARQIQAMPEIKAVVYFNSAPRCPNWIDSSRESLRAFTELANTPYLTSATTGAR
jgi:hypothetical protein